MPAKRKCVICGRHFNPCPKVPDHKYCDDPECKREARRRWKKQKYKNDKDFRLDQADYCKTWRNKNPDYWRRYRARKPEYVEKNRLQQRVRNAQRKGYGKPNIPEVDEIAKGNELIDYTPIPAGLYILIPFDSDRIAKGNETIVKIEVIS